MWVTGNSGVRGNTRADDLIYKAWGQDNHGWKDFINTENAKKLGEQIL